MSHSPTACRLPLLVLVAGLAALTAGCATTANYEKILNRWMGRHVDDLVMEWGPPRQTFRLSSGARSLEYVRSRSVMSPSSTYTETETRYEHGKKRKVRIEHTTPGHEVHLHCRTIFLADASDILVRWSHEGDDCAARDPDCQGVMCGS
ncbi:MAG: hypothetical protein HY749_12305 [Gammaproteobacteria bacterium]|nr:hypothetical protein [Gammaproteobacteria bacterium]